MPAIFSSAWPITKNCGAGHHTVLREIVERCVMHAQPVVPKGHIAQLPAPAHREFGLGDMGEQEGEQCFALFGLQFNDPRRKAFVDEQSTPSVLERTDT